MMKSVAAAALAATMLMGTAISSQAAVTKAPTPTDGGFTGIAPTGVVAKNPFDYFAFVVPFLGSYTVSASVITTFGGPVTIKAFDIFSDIGTATAPGTIVETGTPLYPGATQAYTLAPITLAGGTYYLGVSATTTSKVTGNNGYGGALASVNTVPLPNTIAMLGTAIAAVGIGGAVRRKVKSAAA